MELANLILEFIKALSLASIPLLIFYFRKPLSSLAQAASDIEFMKWGKRGELKRRKQELNKILDKLPPDYEKEQMTSDIYPDKGKLKDQLILIKLKQYLVMSNLALSLSLRLSLTEITERLKKLRDDAYRELKSSEPDSHIISFCDSWVSKNMVPLVEESQQSKP